MVKSAWLWIAALGGVVVVAALSYVMLAPPQLVADKGNAPPAIAEAIPSQPQNLPEPPK